MKGIIDSYDRLTDKVKCFIFDKNVKILCCFKYFVISPCLGYYNAILKKLLTRKRFRTI